MSDSANRRKANVQPPRLFEDLGSSNFRASRHAGGVRPLRSNSQEQKALVAPRALSHRIAVEDAQKDSLQAPLALPTKHRKKQQRNLPVATVTQASPAHPVPESAPSCPVLFTPVTHPGGSPEHVIAHETTTKYGLNNRKQDLSDDYRAFLSDTDIQSLAEFPFIVPGIAGMSLDDNDQLRSLNGLDSSLNVEQKSEPQQPALLADLSGWRTDSPQLLAALSSSTSFETFAIPGLLCSIHKVSDECDNDKALCDIHQMVFTGAELLNPTNLAYYSGDVGWSLVLTDAGNRFMKNTLLFNAFLDRNVDLPEAALTLAAARDAVVCNGYILSQRFSLNRDMANLVFQQHIIMKTAMKVVGRRVVGTHYASVISVQDFSEIDNQEAEYIEIRSAVDNILSQGKFLWGPPDPQTGAPTNMAHPAIEALILEFFYEKNKSIAEMYPQDFERGIPNHALALATTCLQNCLEEFLSGSFSSKCFSGRNYRNTFASHLSLIECLEKSSKHGPAFQAQKRNWARKGAEKLKSHKSLPALYVPSLAC